MSKEVYELFESPPDQKPHTCVLLALSAFPLEHRKEILSAICTICNKMFIPSPPRSGWQKVETEGSTIRGAGSTRTFVSDGNDDDPADEGTDYYMKNGTNYMDWLENRQSETARQQSVFTQMGNFSDVEL